MCVRSISFYALPIKENKKVIYGISEENSITIDPYILLNRGVISYNNSKLYLQLTYNVRRKGASVYEKKKQTIIY